MRVWKGLAQSHPASFQGRSETGAWVSWTLIQCSNHCIPLVFSATILGMYQPKGQGISGYHIYIICFLKMRVSQPPVLLYANRGCIHTH